MKTKDPIVKNGAFGSIIIEGTKTLEGRGWYFDWIEIKANGDMVFGSEEGNYAGGVWLSPNSENYEERKRRQITNIKKHDFMFFLAIQEVVYKKFNIEISGLVLD